MTAVAPALEQRIQELAAQILHVGSGSLWHRLRDGIRDSVQLDEKLMAWAMGNEGLRVQLFRMIDALPSLRSKAEIARHLQEYLASEAVELKPLRDLLNFSTENPHHPAAILAASGFSVAVETLARKYICGANLAEALKTIERLRRDRCTFTIDLLGEAVISEAEASQYLQKYLDLIAALGQQARSWERQAADLPPVQVSVKLSAFYSRFDPLDPEATFAHVSEPVRVLLRHGAHCGCGVHFDMEQSAFKDLTLRILQRVLMEPEFAQRRDVGITVQGYLRDSYRDLEQLIAWARERGQPITVRLVKGAYWDQETIRAYQEGWAPPVFQDKASTDANYEALMELLLCHHDVLYGAIASHNARTLAKAIALAEQYRVPSRAFEVQALYGMAEKTMKTIAQMGHRVRIYCPYGALIPGMSYLIRRLLENTANSSFVRLSAGEKPLAELLAPPVMSERDRAAAQAVGVSFTNFRNAANRDFALDALRQASQDALEQVRSQLGRTYTPWIGGQFIPEAEVVRFVDSVNPCCTSEVIGRVGMADLAQADRAIAAAKVAFPAWQKLPAKERADLLRRAADRMEERRAELAAWLVYEVGKPVREADGEVSEAIDFCRYYASEMERLAVPSRRPVPGEENDYFYQGRGVTVVISPWNFPLAIALGMSVAALAAGNTVVLKPAEQSSVIAAQFTEILQGVGLPPGVFNYLPGKGSEVGAHMVHHPDVHLIAFTGSQEVGCRIYAEAAVLRPGQKHLKRVIAEMGGKNSIIIDESADLDQAVVGVLHSTFGYAGQKCSACSRVIVLAPVYESFVQRLVDATRSLVVGPAHLPHTQMGAVIDGAAQQKLLAAIAHAKDTVPLAHSGVVPSDGFYVPPTIFTDVPPDHPLAQEELFGPVLAVLRSDTFDQALAIANNTPYALTGGLYSRTPSHIQRAYRDFEVGNLYINRGTTGALVDRQPFGGFKLSGIGSKAGGQDYLLQFLEPRVVTENTQRQGFAPLDALESPHD